MWPLGCCKPEAGSGAFNDPDVLEGLDAVLAHGRERWGPSAS